jgi:tRNA-specific 2-thiouridylase
MRCLALTTGGLDAQIAVRMLQRQGHEVVGFHVSTPFTAPVDSVQQAADELQIELIVDDWHDDYLSIVRRPKFGFAAEMAPCLDCRIGMLQRVAAKMVEIGAAFIISGEVVGQRPSSLRSRDLETMAIHGGVEDLLLRPLSARLLPLTLPERNGWVNRELLHGWHGKGRREQLRVAGEWNLHEANGHAPGCLLLQEMFASRLKRLLNARRTLSNAELASLSFGKPSRRGPPGSRRSKPAAALVFSA